MIKPPIHVVDIDDFGTFGEKQRHNASISGKIIKLLTRKCCGTCPARGRMTKSKFKRKPLEVVGWKPKPKWFVYLRRGSAEKGTSDRMTRACDSLEDGRKTAESYFKKGWDEAWISEGKSR